MSSWHCFVEERAEQMRMLRRGAAALVLIAPRRAFLAWGQHALATQRALAKLLRVFGPTRRLLGRAFNTLCDTADWDCKTASRIKRDGTALLVGGDGNWIRSTAPIDVTDLLVEATIEKDVSCDDHFFYFSTNEKPQAWSWGT